MTTPASTTTGPPSISRGTPPPSSYLRGVALFLLVCGLAPAQSAPPSVDARQIILRSAALDQRDVDIGKNYTYLMRTEQRRLDSSGKTKSVESETHEVLILYGSAYRRLVAKNDKPLPPDQERKEQQKMDKEIDHRRKASEKEREKLAREDAKRLEEQKALIREVADAFTFQIVGEEKVAGHDTWVIQADPLPGYHPRSSRARMLPNFRGKLWITKDEYRWAKLEAEVIRTVSWGLVVARLQPGTKLAFEQQRVQEEIWLPSTLHLKVYARLALLKKLNAEVDVTFSNYRKFQSDSRIVETNEIPAEPARE